MAINLDKMNLKELLKLAKKMELEVKDDMKEAELKALIAEKQSDDKAKVSDDSKEKEEKKDEKTTVDNIEKIEVPDRPPELPKEDKGIKVKILEDIGTTNIGNQTFSLKSGQTIVLPKGIAYRLLNTGGAVEVK